MTISDTVCVVPDRPPSLRFLGQGDIPCLEKIDGMSFVFGESHDCWKTKQFMRCLNSRGCIPPVIAMDAQIPQGFMIYRANDDLFEIIRMAADPSCRCRFIVAMMLNKLINKLSSKKRDRIICRVYDGATSTHNILKNNGFRCTEVQRNHHEINGIHHDAYCFEYRLEWIEQKEKQ